MTLDEADAEHLRLYRALRALANVADRITVRDAALQRLLVDAREEAWREIERARPLR